VSLRVNVKDGTNAGVRDPHKGEAPDWTCPECEQWLRGYWTNCPNCGERRPK
jgi:hypothetical protein